VQLVREAHSKSDSVIIEAAGRPPHIEAQFLGGHTNALHRMIQRGNDSSLNSVLKTAGRPEKSRTNDGRVIARNVGNKKGPRGTVAEEPGNATSLDPGEL
jgi:hypothetical protein